MKNRSAKLLFFILSVTGILLQGLSAPVSGLSAEFRIGAVTANVNLRKTPSLQGDIVAGLQKGASVRVYGEKDDWYRISSKKNYILFNGWVYKRYVEIVSAQTAITPPDTEIPKSVPATLSEKPHPVPMEKPTPPEPTATPSPLVASSQTSLPVSEPENQTVSKPPVLEIATEKTEKQPPVEKALVSDTGAKPAGSLRLILSISPLVLAIIALLIAVSAYRAARASNGKLEKAEVPTETTPAKERPTVHPENPPVNEKRQSPRTNRLIEVDFAVDGKFHRGFINNLSETGVYVDTPAKFSVGQEITISCPSIGSCRYVKLSGLIIRKTEVGYAVHFQQNASE